MLQTATSFSGFLPKIIALLILIRNSVKLNVLLCSALNRCVCYVAAYRGVYLGEEDSPTEAEK